MNLIIGRPSCADFARVLWGDLIAMAREEIDAPFEAERETADYSDHCFQHAALSRIVLKVTEDAKEYIFRIVFLVVS